MNEERKKLTGVMRLLAQELGREPNRDERRALISKIEKENKKYTEKLERQSLDKITREPYDMLIDAWRSCHFIVQLYDASIDYFRISVNRTEIEDDGSWKQGISWDQLQRIKNEIGFDGCWGFEAYPPASKLVNVANIRHIFVLKHGRELPFGFQNLMNNGFERFKKSLCNEKI